MTTPAGSDDPGSPATVNERRPVAAAVAVLCLAGVLLDATANVLPDQPLVWPVTPLRLVLGVGLVAAVISLGSPLRCRTALDPAVAALVFAAAVATAAAG